MGAAELPEIVQTCPVCSTSPAKVSGWGPLVRVECARCGRFALTDSLAQDLPDFFKKNRRRAALMSHTIRRMQRDDGSVVTIVPDEVESYWKRDRLPTPMEQADELILWIGDNQRDYITGIEGHSLFIDWLGSALPGNLEWLVREIDSSNPVRLFKHTVDSKKAWFLLTMDGWKKYAALKQTRADSRIAFMAMKFGDAELDIVVDRCFRPAVARTGFELQILTDQQRAGLIDDQIRAALISARFVIADLTHGSFGAYWEAGFADGRGLPVIYTCRRVEWEKAKTHFDTNHMTTVVWDSAHLKKSEDEMTAIIRATLRSEAIQSD
jgi:hypothetical protein